MVVSFCFLGGGRIFKSRFYGGGHLLDPEK